MSMGNGRMGNREARMGNLEAQKIEDTPLGDSLRKEYPIRSSSPARLTWKSPRRRWRHGEIEMEGEGAQPKTSDLVSIRSSGGSAEIHGSRHASLVRLSPPVPGNWKEPPLPPG
ncbi:hypothetical protein GE21DRAFT_1308079 [Neurospora crassa]|nr:hypothetical protein GE21DRAFT_1308079 [Neurospora crassa]